MQKPNLTVRYLLVGICVIFLFNGCAIINYGYDLVDSIFGEEEDKRPAELMSEATAQLEKGNYEEATDAFQQVKDRYPYSRFAITAEIKMADALYKQKEFDQAFEAYDEFERLHPKNKEIPYVIYQKGDCHLQQVTTVDRDQTHTQRAKEEFERLIKRFPRNDYAKRARKNIRKCLIYLAEYELYVGHYYYKMGKYRAAMARFSYIIRNYPDIGQYHEAMEYITKCKEKLASEEPEEEKTS